MKRSEQEIEIEILQFLRIKGWFVWKAEYPIRIKAGQGHASKHPFIKKGVPDILGLKDGIFLGIEVKLPEELRWWTKMRDRIVKDGPRNKKDLRFLRQHLFIEEIKHMGGWGGFASDMDEAREIVREAQKNRGSRSPGSVSGEGVSDLQNNRDHRWASSQEQGIGGTGCPGESDPPVS